MTRKIFLFLIQFYRSSVSPLFRPTCRFTPSCSKYAFDAVSSYGAIMGGALALKRILRCNPFFAGGYDPVPDKKIKRA